MISHIHELIRAKRYSDAIMEMKFGRGSSLEFMNEFNINYCMRKLDSSKDVSIQEAKSFAGTIVLVGEYKFEADIQLFCKQNKLEFNKIKLEEIEFKKKNETRIFLLDDSPSALDLYRISGTKLDYLDVVLQIISDDGNQEPKIYTVDWLRKLGLNAFLFNVNTIDSHDRRFVVKTELLTIDSRANIPFILAKKIGIPLDDLYKNALMRMAGLEISFLDQEEITKKIRKNLRHDKTITKERIEAYDEGVESFPKDGCELYLKNKYYNISGVIKPRVKEVTEFFSKKLVHKNYYSEIIRSELDHFEKSPKDFLSKGKTVIFLDPTCLDQESGISSYLVNMYKFFKMSRLAEQTLFIKNPWPSSERANRDLFREYVAEKFNPHIEFKNEIIFFDSEAHYPGLLISASFKKICIVHCSSVLAAKFDNKLPEKLPKSLVNIIANEVLNIDKAYKVITPTLHHDSVQKTFYRKELPEFNDYKTDTLINYIHDEYIEYIPFRDRTYDLVFIGRPQTLKGFDVLLEVAKIAKNINIVIVTNTRNLQTDELEALKNVKLHFDTPKDVVYKILNNSKAFIDLSPHHNCSTVLLEAMNAKTPAVIRDLGTYHEMIKDSNLMNLFLLVNKDEILKPTVLVSKIVKYLDELNSNVDDEYVEKLFNKFMLERYVENYRYYSRILSGLNFKKKKYNISSVYYKFLENKRVINVVHSNALDDVDGKIIDSFDIIIRFNRAVENIIPTRHGGRTDILYSCLNRSPDSGNMTNDNYKRWILSSGCWLAKAYPNLQWKGYFSFTEDHQAGATSDNYRFETFNSDPVRTSEISIEWFKLIEANIKSRPNTGILAILDILQYSPKSIYLKGYTFFKGGYDKTYRKQNEEEVMSYMAQAGNHNQYRQNLFIRKIILTEELIEIDQSLSNILNSM